MEVHVKKQAYCKLFLHLAKYPHSACNGILLAKKTAQSNRLQFVDCIPLFHSSLTLSPGIEIALTQIEALCQSNELEIGGYYHATENINDKEYQKNFFIFYFPLFFLIKNAQKALFLAFFLYK